VLERRQRERCTGHQGRSKKKAGKSLLKVAQQATLSQASSAVPMPQQPEDMELAKAQLTLEDKAQATVVDAHKRAADTGSKPVVGAHIWAKGTKLNNAKMDLIQQILEAMFPGVQSSD
jgi:hypothetical protein